MMRNLIKKTEDLCVRVSVGAQMAKMKFTDGLKAKFGERRAQAMLEYGIILVVVVLLLLSTMTELGNEIKKKLESAITTVKGIGGSGGSR